MIKLLQGVMFRQTQPMLSMQYRDLSTAIPVQHQNDGAPFLGGVLTQTAALQLRNWLTYALEARDRNCDLCWDYQPDQNIAFTGAVTCKSCGALIRSADAD